MRSKRFANAFQVLGSSECGVSGFLFPKYPVEYSAGNYETFIGVDDGPYCRELGTARLVIRYESASRPVYLTPGNLECLPDTQVAVHSPRLVSMNGRASSERTPLAKLLPLLGVLLISARRAPLRPPAAGQAPARVTCSGASVQDGAPRPRVGQTWACMNTSDTTVVQLYSS